MIALQQFLFAVFPWFKKKISQTVKREFTQWWLQVYELIKTRRVRN